MAQRPQAAHPRLRRHPAVTPHETAVVRDLLTRVRLAEEKAARLEREIAAVRSRPERRAGQLDKRIQQLERAKESIAKRARKAEDNARYWHGVALALGWGRR